MGLFTPFTRRLRPERSAFPMPPLPLDPAEQKALDELRARREEAERRKAAEQAQGATQ